jgi:two-component system nitrate/nitrite response regulator NarL
MTINLVIVDDHDILREGIKARLSDHSKFQIIGEGANGNDAIALYKHHKPDVILSDISMPEKNGLDAAKEILAFDADAKIMFLSVYDDPEYVKAATALGAKGFILKDVSKPEMTQAICRIANGGKYWGSNIIQNSSNAIDYGLTKRESDVLSRIAQGLTNREIADALSVSVRTIESHRGSIREKTGGGNAIQLAKIASILGL